MSSRSIRALARHLDVPERTLRRAAAQGLVHGERTGPRQYETSFSEEAYLRRHWPLLVELRAALRTEPNVRLAVLFGSLATGRATERSDVDVLVAITDPSAERVAATTGRLERRLGRPVQLVRLEDAEGSPSLIADAIEQGRVLIDRDDRWLELSETGPSWRRRADAEEPLERSLPDFGDGQ